MEKLSDVFGYALTRLYKPANSCSLSNTGMCRALSQMYRRKFAPSWLVQDARIYINDLMEELQTSMQLDKEHVFAYLYEPLESFKGYDVNDLQYLVWQAVIDKLRSEGR